MVCKVIKIAVAAQNTVIRKVVTPRSVDADLKPSAHVALHGLPVAAAANRLGGAIATAMRTALAFARTEVGQERPATRVMSARTLRAALLH